MARIFISHSGLDIVAADQIKEWLKFHGFENLFLDFDKHAGIPPGADWERVLYKEIARSHAVILIVTANWHASKWCWSEFTHARSLGKAIFPVIEKPTGETLIAPDLQSLDLTKDRENGLDRLAHALDQVARAHHDIPWDGGRPPYPGLLAFQEEDAAVYFGRDEEIRSLIECLNARRTQGGPRLIALLGASGSGKSSLLRAGVIPRLKRDPRNWIVVPPFRPQRRPLDEFAVRLAAALGRSPDWRAIGDALTGLNANASLGNFARDLRANAQSPEAQILLCIDQAEELFGVSDSQEADHFWKLLTTTFNEDMPFIVVAALRSDFLGKLQNVETLGSSFEEFSLSPMPLTRLPEIIKGPAEIAGLTVDDSLIIRATQDAKTDDALPLLAFTLRELYERYGKKDKRLTLDEYVQLGDPKLELTPLENAVRQSADNILRTLKLSNDELNALRETFVPGMVRVNDDGEYVGRPARWSDLPDRAHRVLLAFAQARLIVIREKGQERVVEVAHEALLRKWPRLRAWLDAEQEFLIGKAQLERSLSEWERAPDGAKRQALLHGLQLDRAKEWLINYSSGLTGPERQYVKISIDHAARIERKTRRQRLTVAASLLLLTIVGTVGGPWAYEVTQKQQQVRREAERTDIVGEVMAVSGGAVLAPDQNASPYTASLVITLRQKDKALVEALVDGHQKVRELTQGKQRPSLSTSMNGQIYLWQQPDSRSKKAVIISVDDPATPNFTRTQAPNHDAHSIQSLLLEAGFHREDIIDLSNPTKLEIEQAVASAVTGIKRKTATLPLLWNDHESLPVLLTSVDSLEPNGSRAIENSLIFFYFSGPALQMRGQNFLLPNLRGAELTDERRVESLTVNVSDLMLLTADRVAASVFIVDNASYRINSAFSR